MNCPKCHAENCPGWEHVRYCTVEGERMDKAQAQRAACCLQCGMTLASHVIGGACPGTAMVPPLAPEPIRTVGTPKGDPRFHAILAELGALHDRKQADYGHHGDPLANIRASTEWGLPSWVGALIRLNDKVRRLQTYHRQGKLANEGAVDSLNDIAVYAILARILLEEGKQPK